MNLKTIRKPQIVVTLLKLGKGSGYQYGGTFDVTGEQIASAAQKAIAAGPVAPSMTYDVDRRTYALRYHSNLFYTFQAP